MTRIVSEAARRLYENWTREQLETAVRVINGNVAAHRREPFPNVWEGWEFSALEQVKDIEQILAERALEAARVFACNIPADFKFHVADAVKAHDLLSASGEAGDAEDGELAEILLEALPGIANYDSKGNWIGPVANENGWTP